MKDAHECVIRRERELLRVPTLSIQRERIKFGALIRTEEQVFGSFDAFMMQQPLSSHYGILSLSLSNRKSPLSVFNGSGRASLMRSHKCDDKTCVCGNS
jgi:hypothetical protein